MVATVPVLLPVMVLPTTNNPPVSGVVNILCLPLNTNI